MVTNFLELATTLKYLGANTRKWLLEKEVIFTACIRLLQMSKGQQGFLFAVALVDKSVLASHVTPFGIHWAAMLFLASVSCSLDRGQFVGGLHGILTAKICIHKIYIETVSNICASM